MASSVHNWIWLQCTTNSSPENRFGPEKLLVDPEESLAYLMKCFHCHGTLIVHILLRHEKSEKASTSEFWNQVISAQNAIS